jgi:type I restriction enzyme M protein
MRNCDYEEFINCDKVNLDIFWLKDESLEDSANLPAPDIIAAEIMEDLQANFETVCRDCDGFGWRRETVGVSEPVKVDA